MEAVILEDTVVEVAGDLPGVEDPQEAEVPGVVGDSGTEIEFLFPART